MTTPIALSHKGAARSAVLSASLAASTAALTITCDDLTGWPTGATVPFFVCIGRGTALEEKILCVSRSGNVLTVYNSGGTNGRAFDDTALAAHAINDAIEHTNTALEAQWANDHYMASTGIHGVVGALAGATALAATDAAVLLKANLVATVNAKVADYTLVAGDSGEVITMTVGSANTLTIPTGLAAGFTAVIVQLGAGQTTIAASGTTLRSTPGLKLRAQYSMATVIHLGSEVYIVAGDLSA